LWLAYINGAFKKGSQASGWEIEKLFSSLFWLFKDSPSRREDFSNISNGNIFPLKICNHRWLENIPVAQRVLVIWEHLKEYCRRARCKK